MCKDSEIILEAIKVFAGYSKPRYSCEAIADAAEGLGATDDQIDELLDCYSANMKANLNCGGFLDISDWHTLSLERHREIRILKLNGFLAWALNWEASNG